MKSLIILILFVYTFFHVLIKLGGMFLVVWNLFVTKNFTFEELKEKQPMFSGWGILWWSMFEHIVMTFVFVWIIVYLW